MERSAMQPRLMVFDLDGTLYRFEGGVSTFVETGLYAEIRGNAVRFIGKRLDLSAPEAEKEYQRLSPDVSVGLDRDYGIPMMEYFNASWCVDATRYLRRDDALREGLRATGARLALLTAAPRVWADSAIKALGVSDMFETLHYGDGRIRKPDEAAFTCVLEDMRVPAESATMVDDDPKCLEVAARLGMKTLLVSNADRGPTSPALPTIYNAVKAYLDG